LVFDRGYYDSSLNATDEELEAVSNKFHAQWSWIIDQMIWSFEQEVSEENEYDHYYDPYEPGEFEQEEKDAEDSILDREFRMKMGKFNAEKYKAFVERKQLGFTLFGKYYQSLWD
jgi:hypothetical protein